MNYIKSWVENNGEIKACVSSTSILQGNVDIGIVAIYPDTVAERCCEPCI